ncbi:MAG: baseplate J/gp47 family protein [Oscillospiraceae bacterium]
MISPKLDSRTAEDILALIKQKSEVYTPEWLLDYDNTDGGAALARLFAEMFHGTIDRFNRFPDKCYLEFLNMVGVCAKSVSPALGMACAELVEGAPHNVYIKGGTQLFTDVTDDSGEDKRVVFETASGFFATPAELKALYTTAPEADIINRTDLSEETALPLLLFMADSTKNLERHIFGISHTQVLDLAGKSEICVKLTNSAMAFRDAQLMQQLCSPDFAEWYYIAASGRTKLSARFENDHISLIKGDGAIVFTDDSAALNEDEELSAWLFCEMKKTSSAEEIRADHISLNSRSLSNEETGAGITPTRLFFNDTELNTVDSGYCFGKEPAVYDSLYINCSEAFGKAGAEITMQLSVATMVLKDDVITDEVGQEFNNKLLVDKEDTKAAPPDDIYISEVQWEYWNGFGWARLDVRGEINPFSCHGDNSKKMISFVCPTDFAMSVQNAYDGLWIRVRILEVANRLSTHSRWLVPWLKSADIYFDYGSSYLPAQSVSITNNCRKDVFAVGESAADMKLFNVMPDKHDTVYFMFEGAPSGYPVNLYFELSDSDEDGRDIVYEYLAEEYGGAFVWRELKTEDRTNGFANSGILSVFAPSDFAEAELFGQKGCWIRAVDISAKKVYCPRLCGIYKNTVDIVQKESVSGEEHEYVAGRPWLEITLQNKPVISCDLWVNEYGETSVSQLNELKRARPDDVRMVTDDDGQLTECWVKWQPKATLSDSGSEDRHYEIDYSSARIIFGDGNNGRIPAYTANVQVRADYSFGGGSTGNLPAQAIDGLIVGIPFVERMTNILPTCGGSNGHSLEAVRRIGAKRLKHRGRAVTAEDFETIVMEEFTEVDEVRCFSSKNRNGASENGTVTVVVKPRDFGTATYSSALCKRIESHLSNVAGCTLIAQEGLAVIPAKIMRVSVEVTVQLDNYEYAAVTEHAVINAINDMMGSSSGGRIGDIPTVSSVYSALKRVEHISYISKVLLTGEYYNKSEKIVVPLESSEDYRYFIAAAGKHTVRF